MPHTLSHPGFAILAPSQFLDQNFSACIAQSSIWRLQPCRKFFEKSVGDQPVPLNFKQELKSMRCSKCAETPELPQKPRLSLPPKDTPNILLFLDVMQHKIRNKSTDILVMTDQSDIIIRLKKLPNHTALAAFHRFYSRWMSVFDAPTNVLVDCCSNLASEHLKNVSRSLSSTVPGCTRSPITNWTHWTFPSVPVQEHKSSSSSGALRCRLRNENSFGWCWSMSEFWTAY